MSTNPKKTLPAPSGDMLFEQIHDLMHAFRSRLLQTLREDEQGVAGMEMKVLGFFARQPGATQSDLVQHSGRDKGQVARLVKGLLEQGLLERDAEAGRRGGLLPTETGQALHQRLQSHRTRLADQFTDALNVQERVQLGKLLTKLQDSLGTSDD